QLDRLREQGVRGLELRRVLSKLERQWSEQLQRFRAGAWRRLRDSRGERFKEGSRLGVAAQLIKRLHLLQRRRGPPILQAQAVCIDRRTLEERQRPPEFGGLEAAVSFVVESPAGACRVG